MRRPLGAILAVGLAAQLVPAADPTPADALVAQLGSDSFARREAASRELLKLGPSALGSVSAAAVVHPDPEVRHRATRLISQLRRAAETHKLLAVQTVTLDYTDLPLATALNDLRAKTGIPLALDDHGVTDPRRRVTVHTGAVTAWEAVEAFCQQAGLHEVFKVTLIEPAAPGRSRPMAYAIPGQVPLTAGRVPVVLADGRAAPPPGDRSRAVRVLALPAGFSGNRVIRGAGEVVLNLDVTPLPGVKWDDVAAVRVLRAEDETGRPVTASHRCEPPPTGGGYQEVLFLGGMQQPMFIDAGYSPASLTGAARVNPRVVPITLRTNDRTVRALRVLEGVVVGEITQADQVLGTISHLPKAAGTTVAGPHDTRYTLLDYQELSDGRVVVKLRTEGPNPYTVQRLGRRGGPPVMNLWNGPLQTNANGEQFKFTDAAGRALPHPMTQSSSTSDDGIQQTADVELVFPRRAQLGPPATLTVVGNKTATVEVPFRMTNVLLP